MQTQLAVPTTNSTNNSFATSLHRWCGALSYASLLESVSPEMSSVLMTARHKIGTLRRTRIC
jgi:hypothetical protein